MSDNKQRPEIVCLCGSTRFYKAFRDWSLRFTLESKIVLTIGSMTAGDGEHFAHMTPEQRDTVKRDLDELHKRKIDICDYIFVLDVNGYIGDSTRSEMEYAANIGKPIHLLSEADPHCVYREPPDPLQVEIDRLCRVLVAHGLEDCI